MELFFGFIIGVLIVLMAKGKPIKIEIVHKNEGNNFTAVPDMSEVLKENKRTEDDTYATMGEMLDSINQLMVGGDRRGEE